MLERAAASLESCSLQRAVSKPARRCRQLHTGFWQHGASAIDLSTVLPAQARAVDVDPVEGDSTIRLQSGLVASFFLLDFLYPSATLPLLRRMYPSLPRAQDGHKPSVQSRRRQFSSTPSTPTLDCSSAPHRETTEFYHHPAEERDIRLSRAKSDSGVPHNSPDRPDRLDFASNSNSNSIPNALAEVESPTQSKHSVDLQRLREVLLDPDADCYQDIWELYHRIDHEERVGIRGEVVKCLARSHGLVEIGRAVSIFRQIPVDEWDEALLSAGILSFIRAGELAYAADRFNAGLEKGLSRGMEYILADALSSQQWTIALDTWIAYYAAELKKQTGTHQPSTKRLEQLDTIPNQGTLYFAFRSYLATDGAEYLQKIKASSVSHKAFRVFRRHFAGMALWEPCSPEQATIILDTLKDPRLYNSYLYRMFDRWYEKKETRATIASLPAIYQKFRELPDASPVRAVLRGLFKFYYPRNLAGLEQVYRDWLRFHGSLGQWGYEKFLKLHSQRGDVNTVRRLWEQYVAEFPHILKTPRAFRSTLNVYAQTGNVAEATRELEDMTKKYGVKPDLDCWNTVLKAYMRANDYEGTLNCFDRILELHQPSSFTYSHVMAMASKRGDLETALDYFRRSQEAHVVLTKEMALALVVSYCRNDLLVEAERLCAELAERKLTHTAIWNQLLHFNGVAGKVDQCYHILQRMKDYGLEWDDETYGFLLQALVRVNQIHPAYSLLKQADEEHLFNATPDHFAIVMAGAARTGDLNIVDSLHHRLQKSNIPSTFKALVALVSSAMKKAPGVDRTRNLSQEFLVHLREAAATVEGKDGGQNGFSSGAGFEDIARMKEDSHTIGRALMLLVELREYGSAEELVTLYTELFPQFKKGGQFPPNVVSALMLAHYKDQQYDKVMELWEQTWQRVLESSQKRDGKGIYVGNEYDLTRVLNVVLRVFKDREDAQGLADCVEMVTSAGFKLTRSVWALIVTQFAEMGRWDQAMYWCETMLMPGWRGWNPHRSHKEKRGLANTRLLRAPKHVVHKLSQEWLRLRRMAAWSPEDSRKLSEAQEKYPRLYHAFASLEVEDMPPWQLDENHRPQKDLDKLLRNMSYKDLLTVKESLMRQLEQEKKREKRLGIAGPPEKTEEQRQQWKREVHDKVRRFAIMWAKRREAQYKASPSEASEASTPEQTAADERMNYWRGFWDRYDQTAYVIPNSAATHQAKKAKPKPKGNVKW